MRGKKLIHTGTSGMTKVNAAKGIPILTIMPLFYRNHKADRGLENSRVGARKKELRGSV